MAVVSPIRVDALLRIGESLTTHRKGSNRAHKGIDLFAPEGTPVLAPVDGIVLRAVNGRAGKPSQQRAGWWVDIRGNADSLVHRLLHLGSDVRVKAGQEVLAGTRVGSIGGRNTSGIMHARPHVHYEIAKGDYSDAVGDYGERVDPLSLLPIKDYLAGRRSIIAMSDIDWRNILDKVIDIGGPLGGAVANIYAPGTGQLLDKGLQGLKKGVVDEYVPGAGAKPAGAAKPSPPAVASASKPAPPAKVPSVDTKQVEQVLLSRGWSAQQVAEYLRGPQPASPPTPDTTAEPLHVAETAPKQRALVLDNLLAQAGWSPEQRAAVLKGPAALRQYQQTVSSRTIAALPPKGPPHYVEDIVTVQTSKKG